MRLWLYLNRYIRKYCKTVTRTQNTRKKLVQWKIRIKFIKAILAISEQLRGKEIWNSCPVQQTYEIVQFLATFDKLILRFSCCNHWIMSHRITADFILVFFVIHYIFKITGLKWNYSICICLVSLFWFFKT